MNETISDSNLRKPVQPLQALRRYWPEEAIYMWHERLAISGESGPEAEAWAEADVRASWVAPHSKPWAWPGDGSWDAWAYHVRAMPVVK